MPPESYNVLSARYVELDWIEVCYLDCLGQLHRAFYVQITEIEVQIGPYAAQIVQRKLLARFL